MTPRLYIVDLDRTLLNVAEVMNLAEAVCNDLSVDFSEIRKASEKTEGTGWSYSPLQAIKQANPAKFEEFKQGFIQNADNEKLLYQDGREFLGKLKELGKPYIILTYALDAHWQELKLQATGLYKVPYFITKNATKSVDISGWIDEDGNLAPPIKDVDPAKEAWLIDDRGRVFDGLPDNCKGFYLKRPDSVDVREAPLPPGTELISSFNDIVDRI